MMVVRGPYSFWVGGEVLASWAANGTLSFGCVTLGMTQEDARLFGEWIAAGPPKKRYKITRTFDTRPSAVCAGVCPGATPLTDEDIEEVYE